MKRYLIVLLCLGLLAPARASASSGGVELGTQFHRNVVGKVVQLRLQNYEQSSIQLMGSWTITDVRSGEQVSHYDYSDEELELGPGEQIIWDWPQDDACYGICRNVRAGEPVGPGLYEAKVESSLGTVTRRFQIGRYFTVNFRCNDTGDCDWDPFIVYVNTPDEVAQMESEAANEEKTLIVSGIVRSGKPYNPSWRISMAPGSIVLGEVFIEVCDGSPKYVQRHRSEWFGERWCPWSSYVEKVGR